LKSLVIGYGSIGQRHVKNLLKIPKMQIIICTKKTDIKFKKRCIFINSLKKSIQEKPDFALICNNTSEHVKTATILAHAGIDLFIEKPLSNSLNGISLLEKISKNKKLVTMIGCNLRFNSSLLMVKKLLDEQVIGKIYSVHAESGSFFPEWHPYEDYKQSYVSQKKLGGGVILTSIHDIDYLFWFFGKVKEISSFSEKVSNLDINTEDLSSSLLKFQNKILGELHMNIIQKNPSRTCTIIGEKGTIFCSVEANTVKLFDTIKKKWITKMSLKSYNTNQMYIDELNHFMKCVKTRKQTINPISDGIETLKIALTIKKSSTQRRIIKI
jgi:predicted dehydrogenase